MYRKFDVTENLLFAQYFFFLSKHSLRRRLQAPAACIPSAWRQNLASYFEKKKLASDLTQLAHD
jgi:hypothetical protein